MKSRAYHLTRLLANVCLLVSLGLAACNYTPPPPTQVAITIDYGQAELDLPSGSDIDQSREYLLYAGAPVTAFVINFQTSNLPDNAKISIRSGAGTLIETLQKRGANIVGQDGSGNTVNTFPGDGPLSSLTIPGNIGRLRVDLSGLSDRVRPLLMLESLQATQPSSYITPPVISAVPADKVTALPLTLGQPVDLGFSARSTTYYLSLTGITVPTVDVMLIGTGRFRVNSTGDGSFPFSDASASQVRPDISLTPDHGKLIGFLRLQVASTPTLTFAVTNEDPQPAAGHTRFVVLPVTGQLQKLSYPSSQPSAFLGGFIGVDHEGGDGVRGIPIGGTQLDCVNWEGKRGVFGGALGIWVPNLEHGVPICYDGHQGTDFLLKFGFFEMPSEIPVNASASGIVTEIADGNADTCFAAPPRPRQNSPIYCPDSSHPPNFIAVRQDDGLFVYYYHLSKDLDTVKPGWRVVCGEHMGAVGSAGESATPHIHLELRTLWASLFPRDGLTSYDSARFQSEGVDPFAAGLWRAVVNDVPEFNCSP